MGYELHITRRAHWADTETPDIELDEWLTYVNSDNQLELKTSYNIKIGEETQFQNLRGYCEWNAHPTAKELNERPWFSYSEGTIDTKNPDDSTILKMMQIATALNAKVQGDDGEIYNEGCSSQLKTEQKLKTMLSQQKKKAWWKFW